MNQDGGFTFTQVQVDNEDQHKDLLEEVLDATIGTQLQSDRTEGEELVSSDMHQVRIPEVQMDAIETLEIQREETMAEWRLAALRAATDLSLDLSLPVDDGIMGMASPTMYSTASDTSLQMVMLGHVGGWKMSVNDDSLGMEGLDIDDMLADQRPMVHAGDEFTHSTLSNDKGVEGSRRRSTAGEKSLYKLKALSQLQITNELNEGDEEGEVGRLTGQGAEMTMCEMETNGGEESKRSLGDDIMRVMTKVERAMAAVGQNEGGSKMKQIVATNSEELRGLVDKMNEDDNIGGLMVNEEGALLLVSSESSEEVGDRKRKRKNVIPKKMGSVASRLRKKQSAGEADREETKTATEMLGKRPKMAVRKIKVQPKKPCTSLTLAPPMLGLPTP